MRLTEEEKAELRALASAQRLRLDLARLRISHCDDFMVDGVVDSEQVPEALTAYSEFVGGRSWPRRVVEWMVKL